MNKHKYTHKYHYKVQWWIRVEGGNIRKRRGGRGMHCQGFYLSSRKAMTVIVRAGEAAVARVTDICNNHPVFL